MTMTSFLRDKLIFILIVFFTDGIGGFLFYVFDFPPIAAILISSVYLLGGLAACVWEFLTKRAYYNEFFGLLNNLDRKYYISEVMESPPFTEGKLLEKSLHITGKSMNDEIARECRANREYREYVELWVHEIKTPISAAMLICENKGYSDVSMELGRVDRFVEQALFYARSNSVEKDYVIKQINLKHLIGELLKKNASFLIANRIKVEPNADGKVYSDSKWLMFILQQLLDNAVKYGAKTIRFSFTGQTLTVKDDGVGIPAQDLPRIFERGFTGENGRAAAKSTGMGLYLCRELCNKLGLTISAASQNGAEFYIVFPKNPYVTFL